MKAQVTKNEHRFAKEGFPFMGGTLFLAFIFSFFHWFLGLIFLGLFGFVCYFFRNPKRNIPADETLVAPADGKIIQITEVEDPRFLNARVKKVSIFMSPLNVHVNRMPISGVVENVLYKSGSFAAAFSEKCSDENEQNAIVLKTQRGDRIAFVQVAGWLARRIICYAKPGETWDKGELYGLIRFGSRVDMYLPLNFQVKVALHQVVVGGETPIAEAA